MAANLGANELILNIIEKALEKHESSDCPVRFVFEIAMIYCRFYEFIIDFS